MLDSSISVKCRFDPVRLLLTFNASVHKSDRVNGNTPLHWAIVTGNNVAGKLLLKDGPNVDAVNLKVNDIYM